MDTVSVIIPTYNCAERLVRALDSVAAQTFPHERIEILVVDDGSTDDTGERVAALTARSDIVVRYLRQQNAGPGAARNHAMRLARGDAIAFLDDDDTWMPAKLSRQLPLLAGKTGLVYCDHEKIDASGVSMPRVQPLARFIRGQAQLALFCNFFLLTSAVCIQRACVDRVGYFDEQMPVASDYDFFLRLLAHYDIDYVADILLVRTIRRDSVSHRDYALDARTDLATLERHLAAYPDFAAVNRAAVRRRFADYRYAFADRLLDDGRRREAGAQLAQSMLICPSLKAARTSARILFPRRRHAATSQ